MGRAAAPKDAVRVCINSSPARLLSRSHYILRPINANLAAPVCVIMPRRNSLLAPDYTLTEKLCVVYTRPTAPTHKLSADFVEVGHKNARMQTVQPI
jgi:hypothetical protein